MDGRVCLVTGGNSGIGEATATGLAKLGAQVHIVSRDLERGRAAVRRISEVAQIEVGLIVGDLGSVSQIRQLAADVLEALPCLHVLVNNAGVLVNSRATTADGYERTMAINHLGPFLLTQLLLDRLKGSGMARIVTVTSALYRNGRLDLDDLMMTDSFDGRKQYARSKMANVLFTRELAARLEGSGVTANCAHPGVVRTNIGHETTGVTKLMFKAARPFLSTPEKGARTSIHLAASPEVASTSGAYFSGGKRRRLSRAAMDDGTGRRLWSLSQALVDGAG